MKEEAEKHAVGRKIESRIDNIRAIEEKRKTLRNKENKSHRDQVEYAEVIKVRKKRTATARRRRKQYIEGIL